MFLRAEPEAPPRPRPQATDPTATLHFQDCSSSGEEPAEALRTVLLQEPALSEVSAEPEVMAAAAEEEGEP
jgi:hypothetical protein